MSTIGRIWNDGKLQMYNTKFNGYNVISLQINNDKKNIFFYEENKYINKR